ncbi:MAG: hypothetical protein ACPG1C_04170 [Alphaproteobacteria bacterium]
MKRISDFELLEPEDYSDFDQSCEREAHMKRLFAYFMEDETGEHERDFLANSSNSRRDFWFRGAPFTEIKQDELGLRYMSYPFTRILAQFKMKTGYLLIVDRDTTRRVLRLPGVDLMLGAPHFAILFFNNDLEYVFSQVFSGRCIQRRFWLRPRRYRAVERFNPLLDCKIVDEWTLDIRMLSRAWMRIKVFENPPKGFIPRLGYPYDWTPGGWGMFDPDFGPSYFRVRPCFRLSQLNDETFYSFLNYILRGTFIMSALRP